MEIPLMSDSRTESTALTDPTTADFSPDLVRRLLAPLARAIGPRLLGAGQRMRASQFAVLAPAPGHVVLLGDSITEFGLWQEWFVERPVLNRGIGGETSADLLRRLDSAVHEPAAVFLLIGTNDLTAGISLREIVGNVRTLLEEIERRAPGTPVVVQSVMPRTARFRDDVRLLNDAYRALVEAAPEHVQYLDLWPALADEKGLLRSEFTEDGLHLTGEGYAAWVDVLRPLHGPADGAVTVGAPDGSRAAALSDVANLASVSHQTVSRVINDLPHVSIARRRGMEQATSTRPAPDVTDRSVPPHPANPY
jgi:lysophospholipase L1-like esterase